MAEDPGHTVTVLLKNDRVRISRVEIAAGGTVPPPTHHHDYAMLPTVAGHIKKSTYNRGQFVKEEDIDLIPDKPYWVKAPGAGIETSSINTGTGPVIFSKVELL